MDSIHFETAAYFSYVFLDKILLLAFEIHGNIVTLPEYR